MKIQDILPENEGIDALLYVSPISRRYLTGFDASDGFLLVCRDKSYFFTDSRYTEAAEKTITNCDVLDSTNVYKKIADILNEKNAKTIAIEDDYITLGEFQNLKEKSALKSFEFITDSLLSSATSMKRQVKNENELLNISKAQQIAEKAFDYCLGVVRPGMTEKELQLTLDYTMLKMGADALSFDTICASGKNSSMPHAVPTNKKIEEGDPVTMDFGAVVNGYHSDMTRTFFVGHADDEMKKVYNIVLEAQKNAIDTYCAGVKCSDGDFAARNVIEKAGFGKFFGHSTGHGVGVEIHERPFVSPKSKEMLKSGNVVSVEPGIYLPGRFGVRIEDIVVITDNGNENLVKMTKEIVEI